MISSFRGPHAFLSNFFEGPEVTLGGMTFRCVEYAYQAAKTRVRVEREAIQAAKNAGQAKRLGGKPERGGIVTLRPGWAEMRVEVMRSLIAQKFDPVRYPAFVRLLLDTGDTPLLEGNLWHDNFFGKCWCSRCRDTHGENHLGRLLMERRAALSAAGVSVTDTAPTHYVRNKHRGETADVYIGRGSFWGNPYPMTETDDRGTVLRKHQAHVLESPALLSRLAELRGRTVLCFCAPAPCHGETLVRLANLLEAPARVPAEPAGPPTPQLDLFSAPHATAPLA